MPCTKIFYARNFRRLALEDVDELVADDHALALRIFDAAQAFQKSFARIDGDDVEMQQLAKRREHFVRLVPAQQTVIDEDAGELLADRARDEGRRNGRIDAA